MTGMSHENSQEELQTLGAFLRAHREQKGLSIEDVIKSTKISTPVLVAIEEDDYERLPAAAFCRGFYTLYADFLDLDKKDILERLSQDKGLVGRSSNHQSQPPVRKSHNFSSYAEPSAITPATGKSITLIACIIAIIGICWYFNWNPADFIANKLNPQVQSQDISIFPKITETEALPPPASASETIGQAQKNVSTGTSTMAPYKMEIEFYTDGILKVTLDNGFVMDKHFTAGKTLQWEVKKNITLDMPETIQGNLRFNGIKIHLPKAENGRRRLSLPEDLLD